ncbi:MAG: restriction endonuclease subunit S [Rickettsia endosymbiont of Oxypoda opaca]|nr:restriction endonuclease subunit S [Rickettsia endosymbiont of Oxypoda opaca]
MRKVNQNNKIQQSVWHFTVKNDGYTLNTKRQKKEEENDLDRFLSFYDVEDENTLLHLGFYKLNLEEIRNNNYISIPNPYRKFEFNSEFKTIELKELIEEVIVHNNIKASVWSVTNKSGGSFIPQNEVFKEKVASDNTENYKLVEYNHFAYSPPRINVGSIALNLSKQIGCVSPIYVVFKVKDESKLNPKYLYKLLQSQQFKGQINNFAFGSVRQTVSFDDFCKITIPLPKIDEQQRIVEELESYYQIVKNTAASIDNWKPYIEIDKDWQNIKLKHLLKFPPQYGISKAMNDSKIGYKILRMGNLQSGELELSDIKYVNITNDEFEKYRLKKGDLLFNRTNSFELVGKTSIFDSEEEYCFASYLVRIVVDKAKIREDFLNFFMNTSLFQRHIKSQAKQANNQANINPQILIEQIVSLPDLETQKNIAEKLRKEKLAITSQKEIIRMFQDKIASKLDSLWRSGEKNGERS